MRFPFLSQLHWISKDSTTGINCEKCINNYFRPFGVSANVKESCIPCECNPIGTIGTCATIGGACTCKPGFVGKKCSECAVGYSGPNCTKCACDSRGTMPGGECESHCQCKVWKQNGSISSCNEFHPFECYINFYIISSTLKENSVINVCLDILDYPSQIKKDVQNVIAPVLGICVRVAISLPIP